MSTLHVRLGRLIRITVFSASVVLASCAGVPKTAAALPEPGGGLARVYEPSGNDAMDSWREDFTGRAIAAGHDEDFVRSLLEDIHPLARWLGSPDGADPARTALSDQAEFARPIWDYLSVPLSESRTSTGRRKLALLGPTLDEIEARFGVDREILLAIWGMETSFGQFMGRDDAINTLANMAVEGRRRTFAETELLATLQMVEKGFARREDLVSGWAGAMGHTQFMPSTYLAHAVDFDGDGRRDVWKSEADALASAANYLARSGYLAGQPWGLEVIVPAGFDFSLADGFARPVSAWEALGLSPAAGGPFDTGRQGAAELWLPAGAQGPAFLLFSNFNVLKTYNRADSYALAVGLSADRIIGRPGLVGPWPTRLALLSVEDVRQLQEGLNRLGYDAGGLDGVAGRRTRAALQRFQAARGYVADGYPTRDMLVAVRALAVAASETGVPGQP